jgi:hypothetical protein
LTQYAENGQKMARTDNWAELRDNSWDIRLILNFSNQRRSLPANYGSR